MKIDLTCPAEVWRTALPGAERPACELTLYNLSDKLIVSVEVTLTLLDAAGEEIARVIHRAHDLHGLPEKPFSMLVPVEEETAAPASAVMSVTDNMAEAMEALVALGYSTVEARNALSQVKDQSDKPEELIRLALRAMAGM